MEKQKKKTSKEILFNDISNSVKKLTSAGAAQIPNLTPKQYTDRLVDDSESLWISPKIFPKIITENVPGTDIVPGTKNVPQNLVPGTENVPGTDIVPGTKNVPGTVYVGTENVPDDTKAGTENVPGTVYVGTDIVPGTENVPGTDIVPGTENESLFFDSLINTLSNTERFIILKKIIHLPVSPTSKLVLLIFLNKLNRAKQKISLRSISREYKLRWSTLLESLTSLEQEEIIKADHRKNGTVIDLNEFLNGTETVPHDMYVCSMYSNISNTTNNKHVDGTETVPPRTSFERKSLESNIRLLIGILEMMEITSDGRNNKSGFSRAIAKVIKEGAKRESENVLAMVVKTREAAKSNKSGYFLKLCKEMDPDEITEEMLKEVSKIKDVYHAICSKEFDNPSLDELKRYAKYLGEEHYPNLRSDLVNYLSTKADFLLNKVEERLERMKEWGLYSLSG